MDTLRSLKTEKGRIFNELQDVYKVAENEKRALSADEVTKSDKMMADMDEKDRQIKNLESFAARKKQFNNVPPQGGDDFRSKKEKSVAAFNKYL